eukprot:GILI01027118.1.p1 GENE.GILI01027118.1~~GILI01027118.1.p1  ORF type:complete len:333 (-),score=72.13 GILI01027118.1:189-1187(-)
MSNLQAKASPWQPNANTQMNVTAAPFRPPPFSLSQDPMLAAARITSPNPNGGAQSGSVGRTNSNNHMNASSTGLGSSALGASGNNYGGPNSGTSPYTPLLLGPNAGPNGPQKYKTELCRNWEATGQCAYRGCTYAHGFDDMRGGGGGGGGPGSMGMLPQPQSMNSSPQQHTYAFSTNVVNAASALAGTSTLSSAMGTPVAGTYRMGGAPAPMGVGGGTSPIPATPTPIQPINTNSPAAHTEHLIELIVLEMRSERDKLLTQQSNNRSLEQQLKREQMVRQRNVNNSSVVEDLIRKVDEAIRKRHAALTDIKRALGEDAMEAVVDAMLDGDAF